MLKPFSDSVHPAFRIKFCLDTNILNYHLNNDYPSLSRAIDVLSEKSDFVDIVTTRYILFELLEVRKRHHFNMAANEYFMSSTARSIFAFEKLEICWHRLLLKFRGKRKWILSEKNVRTFHNPVYPKFYYSLLPEIKDTVLSELTKLKSNTDIRVSGDIHSNLWEPTENICLSTRLNREDSLVLTSTLMPDALLVEDFISVLTNDKSFNDYFSEAPNLGVIFSKFALRLPTIGYIQRLEDQHGRHFNLTSTNPENETDNFVLSYIKKLIIKKNEALYVGETDQNISPKSTHAIGLKLNPSVSVDNSNYLLIISKDLDFVLNCPIKILDYRDKGGVTQAFPITGGVGKVVFKWPDFLRTDPLFSFETEILSLLKRSGNMVFIHPDSL